MGIRQRKMEMAKAANLERYGYAVVDSEEARLLAEAAAPKVAAPAKRKKLFSKKKDK